MISFVMFFFAILLLLIGVNVAYAFGFAGLLFAILTPDLGIEVFRLLPYRIYGVMQNFTLISVPLFILMGLILEKTDIAKELLLSMAELLGKVRGGLAISVVLVGAILAASTGIVGASVVMMGIISLPLMLKHGYSPTFTSGLIASSGTLGQIIPPSIVLIILGDVMHVSVGDLFVSAVVPGFMLVGAYILYILYYSYTHKEYDLRVPSNKSNKELFYQTMVAVVPALLLIVSVLGSIFSGLATPTESASIGVVGALLLALFKRKLTFDTIKTSTLDSVKMSGMIFMILVGATAFSLVFNELGGSDIVLEFFEEDIESKWVFVALSMIVIFVLGFFLDFIEISFIVVPILTPIVATLGIDPIWFAILIALNLQTSFLTPPFGFALFFLKGAVGELVNIKDIYKGVIPFIIIQLIVLLLIIIFPSLLLL
jgi:tripartite ATP-independent transporter DctM subunit